MKNTLISVVLILVLAGGGYYLYTNKADTAEPVPTMEETTSTTKSEVTPGTYAVIPSESILGWSAKKPLIDGYVNSGTIGLSQGLITVTETNATGSFTIDMNTIDVGLTAKKPGKEGALEGHLKKDDFFDVATFPTATFTIKSVTPTGVPMEYTLTGDLTMKGKTNELTFPATIYLGDDGKLTAEASFEFDRTKWGITYNSGNFFTDLGDSLIDDMVAMTLSLKAE